jgi:hypothetical protein
MKHNSKRYKIFWCSCIPIIKEKEEYFYVSSLKKVRAVLNQLTERDLKNESITDNIGEVLKLNELGEYEVLK